MRIKIIIKRDDFNNAIYFFLQNMGTGMVTDWNVDALEIVRNALITTFEGMGITIETYDQLERQFN